jgi:hypothetical protein
MWECSQICRRIEANAFFAAEINCNMPEAAVEGHMRDLISLRLFQIKNRHIANQLLMQELGDVILSPQIRSSLINYCKELQKGWDIIKNNFVRLYLSKYEESVISNVNEKAKSLFSKEIEMWDMFLKYAGE